VDRRTLLRLAAVGLLVAGARIPVARAGVLGRPVPMARVPAPNGVITRLPGGDNSFAFTVDDGASSAVVAAIVDFCRNTGTRLTFFVNGANKSWTDNAPALRPLVDSGQVQLGNHTWSHPDITRIGLNALRDQIRRNEDFLQGTYGVDGTPFFRPPFGRHNADTDRVSADMGYHTITMWSGTIGDSRPENENQLIANASQSFQPGQIVLAHANLPTITHCFDQLQGIIQSRNLQPVTLADAFS
jgi:peptidoglycan-N-acetylglucosamine deacetylase